MQVHYSTTPAKVFNMRADTLATMMHAANVGPHARVLCVDATGGVAAAACAERMGGTGTLCCPHVEATRYPLDYARLLNCPKWLAQSARHCALTSLLAAKQRINSLAAVAAEAAVAADDETPAKKQKTVQGSCSDAAIVSALLDGAPSSSVQPQDDQNMHGDKDAGAEPSSPMKTDDPSAVCSMEVDTPAYEATKASIVSVSVADEHAGKACDGTVATSDQAPGAKQETGDGAVKIRPARAATQQLRLGKKVPEGFKIPEVIIGAGMPALLLRLRGPDTYDLSDLCS